MFPGKCRQVETHQDIHRETKEDTKVIQMISPNPYLSSHPQSTEPIYGITQAMRWKWRQMILLVGNQPYMQHQRLEQEPFKVSKVLWGPHKGK